MKRLSALVLVAVTMSCGGGSTGKDGGSTGGGSGGGTSRRDAGSGGGGGTTERDAGAGGATGSAPQWSTVDARVAGRTGKDLRIGVKGTDRDKNIAAVTVKLMDGQGGPVIGFDTDHDGQPDSAEGNLPVEGMTWAGETVTGAAIARGVFNANITVVQVAVTLIDAVGLTSDEKNTLIEAQPVVSLGDPCDATFVANRCGPGFGCRGTPTVCSEGLAPQVSRMAFYKGTNGPTILLEGTEPEDDLSVVRFQFQNAAGQNISIDSDGDGTPDLSSFDQDAASLAVDGAFFLRMQSGADLDQQVPKLVATPIDAAGHTGMPKVVSPTAIPTRTAGQTCDPRGFDVCVAKTTCAPGVVGAMNKCATAAPLRVSECSAAPTLTATAEGAVLYGMAGGGSLWDAPAGCSTADPVGRPEGVVRVHLASRADKLTLSTVGPSTQFDTTMYVMEGCPDDSSRALACNDDFPMSAGASVVVLTNLSAGDYLVVIDSFSPAGGAFELHATVE